MLEFRNVKVEGGRADRLAGVSCNIGGGRITGLIGRNGSGKTTLLRCALNAERFSGEVLLYGDDVRKLPPKERAERVSLLPQKLPSPMLTVKEVVAFGAFPRRVRLSKTEWQEVDEVLSRVGISDLSERRTDLLSGGERQKVFIAMSLLQNAKLMLFDEPTTYMDISYKEKFFSLLKEECARGKGILIVLHELSDAIRECDDILLLSEGRVKFSGDRESCLKDRIIEKEFGVNRYTAEDRIFFG